MLGCDLVVFDTTGVNKFLPEIETFFARFQTHVNIVIAGPQKSEVHPWIQASPRNLWQVHNLAPHLKNDFCVMFDGSLPIPLAYAVRVWMSWQNNPETAVITTVRKPHDKSFLNQSLSRSTLGLQDPLSPLWGVRRQLLLSLPPLRCKTVLAGAEIALHAHRQGHKIETIEVEQNQPITMKGLVPIKIWIEHFYLQSQLPQKS